MIRDHMQTERRMCVVYWSGFTCGVYIDLNHRLFAAVSTQLINGMLFINKSLLWVTIITCLTTLVWLSSGLPCLKYN
jgi:hypothetical protein